MQNTKDYKGDRRRFLAFGATGSGKSTAFLTHPGKKFAYVFDPSGLETYRGYDVDVELFQPRMTGLVKGKLGKKSKVTKTIRLDPKLFMEFEQHIDENINTGFFDGYDVVAVESATVLMDVLLANILDTQGRGNSAPEIADYYYRTDYMLNIFRALSTVPCDLFVSAHVDTLQDEVTKRILTDIALPKALKSRTPLMFSEVLFLYAETDRTGKTAYKAQLHPNKRVPTVRTSLRGSPLVEDVTVNWSKSLEGQGLFKLYR